MEREVIIEELTNEEEILSFSEGLVQFFLEIDHPIPQNKNILFLIREFLDSGVVVLAKLNSEIVGFISLIESNAIYAGGKFGIINELYVHPEYRSSGIGAKLIGYVQKSSENKNWTRLELSTPDELEWHRTIMFYEKEGFETVGLKMKKMNCLVE